MKAHKHVHGGGLPRYLRAIQDEIEGYALEYGLDFFPNVFEILTYEQMNMVAAYGGFPTRYPHWRFGMEYDRLSKSHTYGLSKIYEMVINNNPCYSYLLEGNSLVDQKLVMAHVCAHNDFFRNNRWFSHTNRSMIDEMANHGTRIREYVDRFGIETVEEFVDTCLSIDNLIDIHSPYIQRKEADNDNGEEGRPSVEVPTFRSKSYMNDFINPPEVLQAERERLLEEARLRRQRFPVEPERDIVLFLLEHAPLARWQRGILSIIREEAYYFAPQAQTKIMNEGWATYWHSEIMTKKALKASELIDYADNASAVTASSGMRLNPYKLGVELFYHIEERWNRGQFGKEWEDCDDMAARRSWDKRTGLGRQKIFEVREIYNDVTFIDEFLTLEFCLDQKFFTFGFNKHRSRWEIMSRKFAEIKRQLLFQLTNMGSPMIEVIDGNLDNRGELLLKHKHMGVDLRQDWAQDTLSNIQKIWRRPVRLLTEVEGKSTRLSHDGKEYSREELESN
jgi:stage V sporulation protein R